MPREGLEPSRYCYQRILSPLRLPFRHPGKSEKYIRPEYVAPAKYKGFVFSNIAEGMVGPEELESSTSPLSGVCSNQLSYEPARQLIYQMMQKVFVTVVTRCQCNVVCK